MTLIKTYLKYIQEKEWGEDTGNDDAFDVKVYQKALANLSGADPFNDIRHDQDPNLINIYIKNLFGDNKGRIGLHNTDVSSDLMGPNAIEKVKAVQARYRKLNHQDDTDNARMKAKSKRSPDDDWDLRDDNANIHPDEGDSIPLPPSLGQIGGPAPSGGGGE